MYAIAPSLYCAKLRILLRHKGLEWREVPPPGGYGAAEYKALVPAGNLPALLDGELLLADSEVIAEYLEERYPTPPALPQDVEGRAKARARSRFHDTRLEPQIRAAFPYLPGRTPITATVSAQLSENISSWLQQLALLLQPMPEAGDHLTLGECGFAISFAWIDALAATLALTIAWPDPVASYRRRLEALEAVADELAEYRERLRQFITA
jgi:glutathione S-transferase